MQLPPAQYDGIREEILSFLAKYLSSKYPKELAEEHLGLTSDDLNVIQSERVDNEEVMRRCLLLWLDRNPCGLGWLTEVLKQAGIKDGLVRKQAIDILTGKHASASCLNLG